MRNESYLGRVFAFPKLIVFWCLLVLLTSHISAQVENETFESVFGLDRLDNKESMYPEINKNTGQISPIETQDLSEVVDLIKDEDDHKEGTETGAEDVPASTNDNPDEKNIPEGKIMSSSGFSKKMIGKKNEKYVRYGKYFDIKGRDHYFFFYFCKECEKIKQDRMSFKF